MLELTASRRDAMAFTAMSAPTALLLGGKGMLWALPGIAAAALLYAVCARNLKDGAALAQRLPKWILAAEVAFLVAAMAKAASLASLCWSAQGTWPLFSLALLGLAAAGCAYGAEAASRSAAVLTWVCVVFFVILLLPASVKSEWAAAAGTPSDGMAVFAVMLCGMCALMLPARGSGAVGRLWGGMAALVLAVLFVSRGKPGAVPLLTAVKGAELLGTLQRYEAFASCAITIGLYQLLVLFGCAAGEMLSQMGNLPAAALYIPAAGLLFLVGAVPEAVLAVGAAIFWGLIPLVATTSWGRKKDAKKR